jgi:hypothetical protein
MEGIYLSSDQYISSIAEITKSMEKEPFREANSQSDRQKIPRLLSNQVYFHCHKCSPTIPILSQMNSVHTHPFTSPKHILILLSHLRPCLSVVTVHQLFIDFKKAYDSVKEKFFTIFCLNLVYLRS